MPASKWHHVSVRDPKTWKIVATKQFGREDAEGHSDFGIQGRIGRKGGKGPSRTVTLLFDPRLWTAEEAVAWTKQHGEKVLEVSPAPHEPGHKLSTRARGLHNGREAGGLREVLKKHGLGVAITLSEAALVPELAKSLGRSIAADMLSCGLFFCAGGAPVGARVLVALVALPPHRDLLESMRHELAAFATAEAGHPAADLALKLGEAAGRLERTA